MFSLNGDIFAGKNSLGVGSFWDDLTGSNNDSNFTACPAGFTGVYSPSQNKTVCQPEAGGVTVKVDGKEVNPNQPGSGGCPVGFSYVKRADGTGSCVAIGNVTTSNKTWGTTTYNAGGDTYNPAGSTKCPAGTTWDPKAGQCGKGTCPPGTILDKINGTCDKVAGGGGGGTSYSKPAPAPPAPPIEPPPSMMAGISPMMIVAGVLGFAALGAVVYKVRKDRAAKGGMSPNEYGEDY